MSNDPIITAEEEPEEVTSFFLWQKRHPNKSDNTAVRYRTELRKWAIYCEERGIDILTEDSDEILAFLAEMNEEYAEKTVSNARAALSQFYQREGDFKGETPVDSIDFGSWSAKSLKESASREKDIHWLTKDQFNQLEDNVPAPKFRNRLLLRLMVQTGIRASEVATIRCGYNPDWEGNDLKDIDRERRRIVVKDVKNDDSRPVFYQGNLQGALRLWINTEREAVYNAANSEFLFPTRSSDVIDPQQINYVVRTAAEEAGIQQIYATTADGRERAKITSHVLRHTFAMEALRGGEMDTKYIQDALGHADISTTINRYIHEDEEALQKQWHSRGPSW